ncbi:MAG: hypothetical protein ACXVH3_38070, partial [Solirubrobacteraceae bacterium]
RRRPSTVKNRIPAISDIAPQRLCRLAAGPRADPRPQSDSSESLGMLAALLLANRSCLGPPVRAKWGRLRMRRDARGLTKAGGVRPSGGAAGLGRAMNS